MAKKSDDKRLEALLAIGRVLAPKAKGLPAAVTMAFREPKAYLAAHAQQLGERGIDKPRPNLPWIALIDALADAGALQEIDWKTAAEDIEWAIGKLRKNFKLPAADEDASTEELLELAGVALRKSKLQLLQLDMQSDAYPLVLAKLDDAAELVKLAKHAKYGEAKPFGDALEQARREREQDVAEHAKQLAAPSPPPSESIAWVREREVWWIKAAQTAYDCTHKTATAKIFVSHYFPSQEACADGLRAHVAALQAEGFQQSTRDAVNALGLPTEYPPYVGRFPDGARYFLEANGAIVRALELRGDAVWSSGGNPGKSFGDSERWDHCADAGAAQKQLAAEIERREKLPEHFEPIARAAVLKLYGRSA